MAEDGPRRRRRPGRRGAAPGRGPRPPPPGSLAEWAEARSAAKRAEGLLAQGEADAPLRNRVVALLAGLDREQAVAREKARRLEVDRVLLADLESVRGDRAEHWDTKRTDADYAAAFRKAGLDLDATEPAEAGRWLAARSDPVELASYLDDWASVRRAAGRPEADWRRLVAAARAADPDPWRDALRAKFGSEDAEARRRVSPPGRRRRAGGPARGEPGIAGPSARGAAGDRERAARVLRRAAVRHPGDFWIHFELAHAPGETPNPALLA